MNARQIVLTALLKIEKQKSYSNITLDNFLKTSEISNIDKKFATALFYGIIETKITLDYYLSKLLTKPIEKLEIETICILRMGAYQILFMDNVPNSAAVNESVNLTKFIKKYNIKGFVNGVLRNFIRKKDEIKLPDEKTNIKLYLSVKYSCPIWIIDMWIEQYGMENTIGILKSSIGRPPLNIKVNTLITSKETLKKSFKSKNIKVYDNEFLIDCLSISDAGDITKLDEFKKGFFHVQDIASQLCVLVSGAKSGDVIFDMCSAPGGKSFSIAQLINDAGKIYSFDIYQQKIEKIKQGKERLKIKSIIPKISNAMDYDENLGQADIVLCDVPCSGLGIIRRKPEIKYKPRKDFDEIYINQYKILLNSSKYVKYNGIIIYSTCSLNKNENEKIVDKFLLENKNFKPLKLSKKFDKFQPDINNLTLFPHKFNSDGFFFSVLKKCGD